MAIPGDTVKLSMADMLKRFEFLGVNLPRTVYVAMLVAAQKMLRDVVSKRMSNPRRGSTATNLGVDTGTARRSMIERAGLTPERVFAMIGSPIEYVRVHEEGFHGTQNVKAHVRRRLGVIKAVAIGASRGAVVKRAAVTARQKRLDASHPIHVRSHSRKVDIIAKHFIRDTVLQNVEPTQDRIVQALVIAAKTGQVPTPRQLGA
jgi:hypothetical protein